VPQLQPLGFRFVAVSLHCCAVQSCLYDNSSYDASAKCIMEPFTSITRSISNGSRHANDRVYDAISSRSRSASSSPPPPMANSLPQDDDHAVSAPSRLLQDTEGARRVAASMEPLQDDSAYTPSSRVSRIASDAVESFTSIVRSISNGPRHAYDPISPRSRSASRSPPPSADDQGHTGVGLHELDDLTETLSSLPATGISVLRTSNDVADLHLSRDPSVLIRVQSGGRSLEHPPHATSATSATFATFATSGPVVLNHVFPSSTSSGRSYRRRRYLIALLVILIAGGAFFAWKYQQVIDTNDSRPKTRETAMNISTHFSSDGNSSEFPIVYDASVTPLHNASRAAKRSSCSYYSCSSCTYWEGCGWCVPSQSCSSGEEYFTYDEMCLGGRARIDWVWYTSDCASRCSAGSYSSTGKVCWPLFATMLSSS
jgi:hypothetical protein